MKDEEPEARCYDAALRILAVRGHSARQLRTKLLRRKFEEGIVGTTLDRLVREKWLDESRYAADVVRSRSKKLHGPRRIERELQSAGLTPEAARGAVRSQLSPDDVAMQLRTLCEKKLRVLVRRHDRDYFETAEARNKLAGYLLQQGYEASAVIDAVDEALTELRRS